MGVRDNFFDLGGHSLLATQVRDVLSEMLVRDVAIVDLFTYPTIRSLARYLENQHRPAVVSDMVGLAETEKSLAGGGVPAAKALALGEPMPVGPS